nr:hypothetical protein [Tanacetum cinerariifolium]
ELTLLKSIPPRIDETDCDFKEDIRLIEKLLYDNSFPRPPKEFVSANSDAKIKSFSPSPILVKDSDFLIEEIDLFCTLDYPMPLGIMDEDYDSERDILIPKDLPGNNTLSFVAKESFYFDIPPFSHLAAKPPDGDTGILNIKMMGDISDQKAFMHKLMITLASHQEKSPDLLSHRCGTIKKFNTHRSHLNKCPMLIHGQNTPPLDVLFNAEYESDSSDDQSCSDEDVLEKIVSKPLFEEEIIPMESLRTHDSSLPISSKIDSLLDECAGELTPLKSIPPRIDETDCHFKEDIRLIEKLLYDNSSPRPPKEFVSANSDAKIKSFSPSPILVKDSDFLIEEIDLFCTLDYPMPLGIVDEDYDSKRDILIPKDLPSNNTLSFVAKESFYFDIPLFSHLAAKPPDGDTGILNIKMMGDISDQKAFMHKLMITLASHQEKSPDLLSHRCGTVKKFNTHRSHLNKWPMLIYGQNTPPLDDLIDQTDLANGDDLFVDPTPEMFTDEQPPDYSFSPRFDVYPDDFLEIKSDADNFYDDSFDSKGEKIKESELLIDELDLPCDILPYFEYDSFASQDFSRDDDLPLPDNEDK